MADEDAEKETQQQQNSDEDDDIEESEDEQTYISSSSSSSDSDSEYDEDEEAEGEGEVKGDILRDSDAEEDENTAEANFRKFRRALDSRINKKRLEGEEREYVHYDDLFDFPKDPEKWREEDLPELWADAPFEFTKPGWDPVFADEGDWDIMRKEAKEGRDPPIAPFYLPYRKHYPAIPDNNYDIATPKGVIEELDRIEEFLRWVSYIFEDGSSYEGTIWDDLAHGKGVYVAEDGLVRYEGEWLQNQMEGHGVVEVDIPDAEPVPGSKLEAKMRAEGRIISRDFMSPEDKRWLEMDMEDSVLLAGGKREIPFYERDEWIKVFGQKPEKGRYRYAGQWKHGRMHGCGVYEVNEQMIFGRFYFGELLEDSTGCDSEISTLHAGIADVAAAKARMFVNKPDGMVREDQGPYGDPQHPYFYEEDDVWMAPGFVNQFYEVPDYWKTYVQEVDKEREMWLNSFHKAPLRIPMPAELEYWWSKRGDEDEPEFVLINKEPEPDPENPSQLIYTEDPLILHTRSGRIINYIDDDEYGVRLFWQPQLKDGEDVDPEKAEFLPLGFDEFYGKSTPIEKKGLFTSLLKSIENALNPHLEKIQKWAEEKKKTREMNLKLIENELEFIEAEISLEETLEDEEMELKRIQQEEEKRADANKDESFTSVGENKGASGEVTNEGDEEDEEEDEEDGAPTSFGTVSKGKTNSSLDIDSKERKHGKTPFSSLSLSLPSCSLFSSVLPKLQESHLSSRRKCCFDVEKKAYANIRELGSSDERLYSAHFPCKTNRRAILRASQKPQLCQKEKNNCSQFKLLAKILCANSTREVNSMQKEFKSSVPPHGLSILSLHVPVLKSQVAAA